MAIGSRSTDDNQRRYLHGKSDTPARAGQWVGAAIDAPFVFLSGGPAILGFGRSMSSAANLYQACLARGSSAAECMNGAVANFIGIVGGIMGLANDAIGALASRSESILPVLRD